MKEADAAYVAGFFVGDGSIHACSAQIRVVLYQKDKEQLEHIQQLLGFGRLRMMHQHHTTYKDGQMWRLSFTSQRDVRKFIRLVYPYLVGRKRRATIIAYRLTTMPRDKRLSMTHRLSEANLKD